VTCAPVVNCAGQPRATDERFNDFNFWRTELPILLDDRQPRKSDAKLDVKPDAKADAKKAGGR
jgi:hypothetical protein